MSRLVSLHKKVIHFLEDFADTDGISFVMLLECRVHKCSEKKHTRFNLDCAYSPKKHGGHPTLKYELGVSHFHDQIVWIGSLVQ